MRNVTAVLFSDDFSCDGLEVTRVVGTERISKPYEFEVEVVVRNDTAPSASSLVGASAALAFTADGSLERVFSGFVAGAVEGLDPGSALRTCRLRIVPLLSRLSEVSLQGVYTGAVPDIVFEKLKLCDVTYEARLGATYPERDYVAQFAETDLDFVSRHCEHLGISYFFACTREGERVVFTDDNRFIDARADLKLPFRMRGETLDVYRLETTVTLSPSFYMVTDYNYRNPTVELVGRCDNAAGTGGGVIENGAHAKTVEEATALARIRIEEFESRREQFTGESDRPELGAGVMFTLEDHPYLAEPELLVTGVEHRIEQPARGEASGTLAYSNRFTAIAAKLTYRPERRTPVPKISGFRGGLVVAPKGSDGTTPWLEEFGRYHIKLFFDMLGSDGGEPTSRAMRLIQSHAGEGYGMHFPLRPGTEVLVSFVNGDVDRPIIVGAVPNPLTPSPVDATVSLHSRIRTASGVTVEFEDGD